jgi:hypothetical protein
MSVQEGPPKSKRVKKEARPEPETCSICAENYTSVLRKKCVCKYCNNDACSKCIERYLLDRHEDAHCLKCRVNYNDAALHEICTKTYLNQVYFKHRQEVLINRERANLPGLQQEAINARIVRENDAKIAEIRKEIAGLRLQRDEVMNRYNTIISMYYSKLATKEKEEAMKFKRNADEIIEECNKFRELINVKENDINKIRWPQHYGGAAATVKPEEEKKKFIRRCTRDGCQGFLSTAWKCGICDYYSCSKCFKVKTTKQDDPHECTKEDLETAELIKKDCKPCPNCGEFIMKTSGCFGVNVPILMWNGSTKMSQDIAIGDELVGDDGNKRTVLDTTTGVDTLYEVRQSGGGIPYVVNSKHTLVLKHDLNDINTDMLLIIDDYMELSDVAKRGFRGIKFNIRMNMLDDWIVNEVTHTITHVNVVERGVGEYYGWRVDGNNQFLLGDTTIVRNCSQMWCISCQTPWDWTTGKIVTNGIIHNPHYYEWMKRNGGAAPRNPADIPCGGYPTVWELRRMPKGINVRISNKFHEFHRICQELQDISERGYRSHIDNATTSGINVKFLLGDFDEKRWGQNLAKSEKKRKRDNEVQEIFVAFRMVAVELINRVQNYDDGIIRNFSLLPLKIAEEFINNLDIEIQALITMINDALRNVSMSYCYSVPYINMDAAGYYGVKTKNFASEVKKRKNDVVNGVDEVDGVDKERLAARAASIDTNVVESIEARVAARHVAAAVALVADLWSDSDELDESDESDKMEESDDEDIVEKIKYRPAVGGAAATAVEVTATATEDELFNELDRIQGRTKAVDSVYSDDDNAAIQRAIVASLENK